MFQEVLTEEQFFDKYYPGDWRNNFSNELIEKTGAFWMECVGKTGKLVSFSRKETVYYKVVPYENNPVLEAYFIQVKEGYLRKEYKTLDGKLWGYVYLRYPFPDSFGFSDEENGYRIFIWGNKGSFYVKCFKKEYEAREMLEYLVITGIEQEDIIAMGFDTY